MPHNICVVGDHQGVCAWYVLDVQEMKTSSILTRVPGVHTRTPCRNVEGWGARSRACALQHAQQRSRLPLLLRQCVHLRGARTTCATFANSKLAARAQGWHETMALTCRCESEVAQHATCGPLPRSQLRICKCKRRRKKTKKKKRRKHSQNDCESEVSWSSGHLVCWLASKPAVSMTRFCAALALAFSLRFGRSVGGPFA